MDIIHSGYGAWRPSKNPSQNPSQNPSPEALPRTFSEPFFLAARVWPYAPLGVHPSKTLVAPYCAIPRDYLSDTPHSAQYGFLVSQHGQSGAIPLPPFLSVSPLESMRSRRAILLPPPPQKGYLSDTSAIPYEKKANGCDTPLCDTISKGYCAIWGGISHWAAKSKTLLPHVNQFLLGS